MSSGLLHELEYEDVTAGEGDLELGHLEGLVHEGELEDEEFFGRLAGLARRGWSWLSAPGSRQ